MLHQKHKQFPDISFVGIQKGLIANLATVSNFLYKWIYENKIKKSNKGN